MNRSFLIGLGLAVAAATSTAVLWAPAEPSVDDSPRFRSTSLQEASSLAVRPPPVEIPADSEEIVAPDAHCDLVIPPDQRTVDGEVDPLPPGATVCLAGGERGPLRITSVHGAPEAPVVFVNLGRVTIVGTHNDYSGIGVTDSTHVTISGAGEDDVACGAEHPMGEQHCGIVIAGTGRGISGAARTAWITIDHVEITGTSHAGIHIRSKPDEGAHRDSFVLEGITIHSSYLRGVGTEGMYLGSSFYDAGEDPVLVGVEVTDNLVVESGWDGIQVGSAVADCAIAHNVVVLAGVENRPNQRTGIVANRGSVCDIHHNVIVSSAAQGIFVQGNGGNRIHDNLVVGSGARAPEQGDGITIRSGSNVDQPVFVWHNTVVAATRNGIMFRSDVGDGHEITNNLLVAVGSEAVDLGERENVLAAGNVSVPDIEGARFRSPYQGDFRLSSGSPAVGAGSPAGGGGATDLDGTTRRGDRHDAGAYVYVGDEE